VTPTAYGQEAQDTHTEIDASADLRKSQELFWGDRDETNDQQGVELIARAANNGSLEAQAYLALMNEQGLFIPPDSETAAAWARKAADGGHSDSMNKLAFYHLHAMGVPHDPARARELLEQSAALGNTSAMANLGAMYGMGDGVPINLEVSASWYMKAAEGGDDHGRWGLANMYVRGHGVRKDFGECFYWASLVNPKAEPRVPSLQKYCKDRLSKKQLKEIENRIAKKGVEEKSIAPANQPLQPTPNGAAERQR
jgi:TPR repeat protein